jgi:2-dehydropantoate 2-reductase
VKCGIAEDLALERWRKLVWTIPFNGLSILAGGIDTAAILADKDLLRSTRALMDEVIAAANRCGHQLERAAADEKMRRTETMGAYKPSTLIDFENGKALEVEAIWGEPLRRAAAAGAPTPQLQILYSLLKSLERGRQGKFIDSRIHKGQAPQSGVNPEKAHVAPMELGPESGRRTKKMTLLRSRCQDHNR